MILYRLAREIALWQSQNFGVMPSKIRIPQAVYDELEFDIEDMKLKKDKDFSMDGMKILGVPVEVDESLTLGVYDK